jgi:hypothetical protein
VETIDAAGAEWHKSTRSSGSGQCVEVAALAGQVGVRDSKDASGPILVFGADQWRSFLALVSADPVRPVRRVRGR